MSKARWVRRSSLGLTLAVGLLAGCDGCSKREPEAGSPLRFVPADADAVLEIRDIGLLIQAREGVAKHFSSFVPPAQLEGLQKELTRAYGFDPSTAAGLKGAGLPTKGRIVANIEADGKGAVWILPVEDQKKLEPNLLRLVKSRISVDETKTKKVGANTLTIYETQFGAEKIIVAAHVFEGAHVLIAAGRKSVELLETALALKPEACVDKSKEYQALVADLPKNWDLRMTSATGGEALQGALRTAARAVPEARALSGAKLDTISSVGWSANVSATGVDVKAKVRLTEAGRAQVDKVFATAAKPSPGVRSVAIPEAIVHAQVAMDVQGLIDLLAPVGSPARGRIDRAKEQAKADSNIDFEKEILPLLTGHVALSMGVGGLDKVSFQELVGNPQAVLWTAAAVGVKEVPAAIALEKRMDDGLKEMKIDIVERDVDGKTIRSLVPPTPPNVEAKPAPLVETTGFEGAWVFANEPALMDRIAKNEAGASALGGKGGLYLELNLIELNKQLSAFRYGNLPVIYRSLLAKVMDAVKLLASAKLRVQPDEDGVRLSAELALVPLGGS